MGRYLIEFSKTGYMVYTSHLDMIRLFKRAFNRAGVPLEYSNGFNPHPKVAFAQPLSLGYKGTAELMEFTTKEDMQPGLIAEKLNAAIPEGLHLKKCEKMPDQGKSLSARCYAAEYDIQMDMSNVDKDKKSQFKGDFLAGFLSQEKIIVNKKVKQKKKRVFKDIDIKERIRKADATVHDDILFMSTILDTGSVSNLSADLFLQAFCRYFQIPKMPEAFAITRTKLFLKS